MVDKKPDIKQSNNPFPKMEEAVLNFWEKNKIFEKSVENPVNQRARGDRKDYIFYDGPPFATGTPHYGHIVASTMKDVVPRYWTMKGYRVERKWGWDCHGLPIENIVEKEMGSKSKKDIEKMGVEKFNELCRSKVLGYVDEWEKVIRRLGRWADMKNAYKTMDLSFMESVWWVFKQLWDRGLIYEGYRSMHICPRCETTLSQQEVAEGYKDIKDLSAIAKFELVDEPGTFVLAWTTTPWTLIGNAALAVGEKIEYVEINYQGLHGAVVLPYRKGVYILAKDIVWNNLNGSCDRGIKDFLTVVTANNDLGNDLLDSFRKVREKYGNLENEARKKRAMNYFFEKYSDKYGFKIITGKDLVGKKYKPLFDYYSENKNLKNREHGWKIYAADFVTTEEGTGVVHIAPAFGEDDMNLGKKENLPFIQHVNMDGTIKEEAKDFVGMSISPRAKNDPKEIREIDLKIIKFLGQQIFNSKKYEHSYPHCWRCETPLINYATSSWFVSVEKIKSKALKYAKKINWSPAHIKEGRFGNWLEGAHDWSISRQRFWASVIPIWQCGGNSERDKTPLTPLYKGGNQGCGQIKVFGSVAELEKVSGGKITDLHKHIVDKITFPCEKCGGIMKRVPDVLDTWFDSGSMPYAQMHYPFENKEKFEANFPAEFIAEGDDQTRAWFYYLHIIATAIKNSRAFKNVIVNGIVLAEDGKKMAKRLKNYPDPMVVMNKYGADALRYYLCASPVMKADNINFSEKDLAEQTRFINILLNVLSFYQMFASGVEIKNLEKKDLANVLDRWVTSRLEQTKQIITEKMDNYNLHAVRELPVFINDLSTWYVRRSRDRFKGDDQIDKLRALKTLRRTLYHLAGIMAPFMPFMAEHIYQELGVVNAESVHLEAWPEIKKEWIDGKVLRLMAEARKVIELGLAARDEAGIKVRQTLASLEVKSQKSKVKSKEYIELIKDELNVKDVIFVDSEGGIEVKLDTALTDDLKLEGLKREIVRLVNNMRKNAGLTIKDKIVLSWQSDSEMVKKVFKEMAAELKKDTLSGEIAEREVQDKEVRVNGESVKLGISKK